MSKKLVVGGIVVVFVGAVVLLLAKHNGESPEESSQVVYIKPEPIKKVFLVSELHSDILKLIAEQDKVIVGVSPKAASVEFIDRTNNAVVIDGIIPTLRDLPSAIIQLISKSSKPVAGIMPEQAKNALIKRYASLDSGDIETAITRKELIDHSKLWAEQKEINAWADNEDAEELEKFIKEIADSDPSSPANILYGIHHRNDSDALTYIDRYKDSISNTVPTIEEEEQEWKDLIVEINKIRGS